MSRSIILVIAYIVVGGLNAFCQTRPPVPPVTPPTTATYKTIKNVAYGTDRQQIMDIYVPKSTKAMPAIIMIHGGGWVSGDKTLLDTESQFFAQNGYVVANIDYRLSTQTTNHYPLPVNDVVSALTWLQTNAKTYQINSKAIAVLGTSVGGYYANELANTGRVQALIDFYGPVDLTDPALLNGVTSGKSDSLYVQAYMGVSIVDNLLLYYQASPINFVAKTNPPTLILQGTLDYTCPEAQSEEYYQKLQGLGVPSQLILVPNVGHGFLTSGPNSVYLNECLQFLNPLFLP